jgi:hypothetical protein
MRIDHAQEHALEYAACRVGSLFWYCQDL